jgi:integrase
MAASKRIAPVQGLQPTVFATVVGLLYSTGLRIGEALKLTIGDVDLKRRLIHVREAKFKKSRYVTLSPSTVDQLVTYLHKLRKADFRTSPAAPLFVAPGGGRYGKSAFTRTFLEVVRKIGIRGPKGQRGPRVHDFRHYPEFRTIPSKLIVAAPTPLFTDVEAALACGSTRHSQSNS